MNTKLKTRTGTGPLKKNQFIKKHYRIITF